MGAGSARVLEVGDAGRLIRVRSRWQARVDLGHAQRAVRRRIEIGVEHAAARLRNWSLRLLPSRTCSAGLRTAPTSSCGVRPKSFFVCGLRRPARAGARRRRLRPGGAGGEEQSRGARDKRRISRRCRRLRSPRQCCSSVNARLGARFPALLRRIHVLDPASTCCASAMPSSTSSPTRPTISWRRGAGQRLDAADRRGGGRAALFAHGTGAAGQRRLGGQHRRRPRCARRPRRASSARSRPTSLANFTGTTSPQPASSSSRPRTTWACRPRAR